MARHEYLEHSPKRRLLGHPRRCVCGNQLPCTVAASIERQRFFKPEAAPNWTGTTRLVPTVDVRPAAPRIARPLLTPGQAWRAHGGHR
jgi:hypothetical protein